MTAHPGATGNADSIRVSQHSACSFPSRQAQRQPHLARLIRQPKETALLFRLSDKSQQALAYSEKN
jgi:hypothetical protein